MNAPIGSEVDAQALGDSALRYLEREYSFARRQRIAAQGGFDPETWTDFAGMGWLALPFPEALDGLGGSRADVAVIMEAFGEHLVLEPYLACIVACGGIVAAHRPELTQSVMSGALQLALVEEEGSAAALVPNGAVAQHFILMSGGSLMLVERHAACLDAQPAVAMDGSNAAVLRRVAPIVGEVLCTGEAARQAMQDARDAAAVAACAELVGIQRRLVRETVEHMKTRKQFGVAIAEFQALRHRLADMVAELELSDSLAKFAASASMDDGSPNGRATVAAAKYRVVQSARRVAKAAVQIHGGMGMSEEHVVAHGFKRVAMLSKLYGDIAHQLSRLADWSAALPLQLLPVDT